MRRSGSASCLLRPKNSLSSEDLQRLAEWVKAGTPPTTVLTVVDKDKAVGFSPAAVSVLGSPRSSPSRSQLSSNCVVDRLYILSELHAHANSIFFLCEETNQTHSSFNDGHDNSSMTRPVSLLPKLPPSIILYLLWKDSSSVQSFVDETLTNCVRRCLQLNRDGDENVIDYDVRCDGNGKPNSDDDNDDHDDDSNNNTWKSRSRSRSRRRRSAQQQMQQQKSQPSQEAQTSRSHHYQMTRIYVIVDRISRIQSSTPMHPALDAKTTLENGKINDEAKEDHDGIHQHRYNCEVTFAKQLARAASASSYLRERIDGITVGITSDDRATPGLEACMDAVVRGAKERRRYASQQVGHHHRSNIGGRNDSISIGRASLTTSASKKQKVVDDLIEDAERDSRERRCAMLEHIRNRSPERSPVAIVTMHPEDLDRMDHHHHHSAAKNIHQCRVSTEWNGNGECNSFTDRAMRDWREVWYVNHGNNTYAADVATATAAAAADIDEDRIGVRNNTFSSRKSRVPRTWRGGHAIHYREEYPNEPISTAMVIAFLILVAARIWSTHGDTIRSFTIEMWKKREVIPGLILEKENN